MSPDDRCGNCGHMRSEHNRTHAPCVNDYGGWCNCEGFRDHTASDEDPAEPVDWVCSDGTKLDPKVFHSDGMVRTDDPEYLYLCQRQALGVLGYLLDAAGLQLTDTIALDYLGQADKVRLQLIALVEQARKKGE